VLANLVKFCQKLVGFRSGSPGWGVAGATCEGCESGREKKDASKEICEEEQKASREACSEGQDSLEIPNAY
jgi:hypothetical protein